MTPPACPYCPDPTPLRVTYRGKSQGWSCPVCGYEVRGQEGEAVTEADVRAVGEELRS